MNTTSQGSLQKGSSTVAGPFISSFVVLIAFYALWLLAFWPGHLGEDSLAVLLEIQTEGKHPSGKPAFWFYFVKLLSTPAGLIQIPIAFQLAFTALVFSRILSWSYSQGFKKTFWFSLFFIALAPHMVAFAATLYPDATFAVASTGLLFELWLCCRKRQVNYASVLIIALTFPFAAFARANGVVFIAAMAAAVLIVGREGKVRLLLIGFAWTGMALFATKMHDARSHGALFPMVVFETANFLQPHPMNLWREKPRVTQKTIDSLTRNASLEKIVQNYDPDYWDTLVYKSDGPQITNLPSDDTRIIVKEFFRNNLWQNIPAFVASRVNVFLVSGLAQGGLISLAYTEHVLRQVQTQTSYRPFQLKFLEGALMMAHRTSEKYRWLLWTPFLGIFTIFLMIRRGHQSKDKAILLVAIPMALQLAAIFMFSIAGEYRYLLPFFTLPLAALPILATHQSQKHVD